MVIDHVHDHCDLPLMALFDEFLELLWRAVFGLYRGELHGIVAPIVVCRSVDGEQGILSDRAHFHRIDTEALQVGQFLHGTGERVAKCTYVHLVNDHAIESGLGEGWHTEVRVHEDGLGLTIIARKAIAVGQIKSGKLLSPGIVEFALDATEPNDIPILISRLGAGHRAYPTGIGWVG